MLIDLHNHSFPKSDDSVLSIDTLLDLYKQTQVDAVCLTEHDTFWTTEETKVLSERHGLLVIPGVEINTDNGHVIVFGLEEYIFGMHKIDFLTDCVEKVGGAMIAAHPYRRRFMKGMDQTLLDHRITEAQSDPLFKYCDAIEGMNGRGTIEENEFSVSLAETLGLPITAGSDAHSPLDIGKCCTEVGSEVESVHDLIGVLKRGDVKPVILRSF